MKQWVAVLLAGPVLLVSACDKKPVGQVVAVVNGEEIGQQELNDEVQNQAVPPNSSKTEVLARALDQIVSRKLLAQAAKAQQIDRTPQFVTRQRKLNDELLVASMLETQTKKLPLPDQGEIDRFVAAHPTIFANRKRYTLNRLVFSNTVTPDTIQRLRPLHTLDAIGATLAAANVQFTRSSGTIDTASLPPQIVLRLQQLPAGEPFVIPQGSTLSANVIVGSEAVQMTPDQIKPAAVELIRNEKVQQLVQSQLATERGKAKIEYQKGFGPAPTPNGATPQKAALSQ